MGFIDSFSSVLLAVQQQGIEHKKMLSSSFDEI
jgi:hypothetical protein